MAYLANVAHKNFFTYSRIVTTMSNLNRIELFYAVPNNSISYFLPIAATVKHISGTPNTNLILGLGITGNTYNDIAILTYPTAVGNFTSDEASNSVIVAPGVIIYMKNYNALSNSTNLVFELVLFGTFFTAF